MTNENNLNLTEIIREIHDGVAREMYCKGIDDSVKKICEKYTEEESNGNYRFYAVEIKQSIADLAEQLKRKGADMSDYVWIWVKNPYSKEMNNYPEKELRKYKVKERKKNCIVLHNGKQYPYTQCFETKEIAEQKLKENFNGGIKNG